MKPVTTYVVAPTIPDKLLPLKELAYNAWWCWQADAVDIFRRLDPDRWEAVHHNPVALLGQLPMERLASMAERPEYVAAVRDLHNRFRAYMDGRGWFSPQDHGPASWIAYFCAEFGIHESFSCYSGGLGVLAGDHLKSASDIGLPLVGVGLLYHEGYFRQYLTQNGWQNERYTDVDFHSQALTLMRRPDGTPLHVTVDFPLGPCHAHIWRMNVGRVPLYLLDTNVPENTNEVLRTITARLYGGTVDTRIMQEMLLGIGGMRALALLGIDPAVCHINEGHAAFSMLERARGVRERLGLSLREAWEMVRAGSVFTTHTPVPAGNEIFHGDLMQTYFAGYAAELGLTWDDFMAFGTEPGSQADDGFSMTILGLRGSSHRNGVSILHGEVARTMWHGVWPDVDQHEVPIGAVTNGVHTATWVAADIAALYDRYLAPAWRTTPDDPSVWDGVEAIPAMELWRAHERRRELLVLGAREHILHKHQDSLTHEQRSQIHDYLDPDILTIGFARRFASYKRADLLLRDTDRLEALVRNTKQPVQFILAGKAHPRDIEGKELLQRVLQRTRQHGLEHRIVFLEDYDMATARLMVRGCDVWLNTPRRPYEASGTSGMKSVLNGGLHCSILDGWWAEAYDGTNGFAIGRGEVLDTDQQDSADSETLYDMLEHAIVPMFYDRPQGRLPLRWIAMMKRSIRCHAWRFSAQRMVRDYAEGSYLPAMRSWQRMEQHGGQAARELVAFTDRIGEAWPSVRVGGITLHGAADAHVGKRIHISADVYLAPLRTDDVVVQAIHGRVGASGYLVSPAVTELTPSRTDAGAVVYEGVWTCEETGAQGCTVRVVPRYDQYASMADTHRAVVAR